MDRSTSSETATNIVNTEATDHVGVKAKERSSCVSSPDILAKCLSN